jgi:Fur family ferric uptake transcriptional regulator
VAEAKEPRRPAGREEKEAFAGYLARHGLKRSAPREVVADTFFRSESHLSVDDLHQLVQRKRPEIGHTTVYRTLKLLQDAGLAQEITVAGQRRFERAHRRAHHDHFVCSGCGAIFEFVSPEIERLQEEVAASLRFVIEGHHHQIHGRCRRCAARPPAAAPRRPA